MTARELYDATLIELNKVNAPTFTIEQWNYFVNKAIQAYCDRRYNFYAMNQQLTDDLRVLLSVYTSFNPESTKVDTEQTVLAYEDQGDHTDTIYCEDITDFAVGDKIMLGTKTTIYTILELLPAPPADPNPGFRFTPAYQFALTDPGDPGGGARALPVLRAGVVESKFIGTIIYKVYSSFSTTTSASDNSIYSFFLEYANYYHILAVRTYWTDVRGETQVSTLKCDPSAIKSVTKMYPAKRLTYDMLANIENNAYLKPMYRQPYHQLHDHYLNVGTDKIIDAVGQYQNTPEIEVHAGKVPDGITLQMIEVDYLKLPEVVLLTDEEVYTKVADESQLLEWPDYLNSEIISMLVSYFIENVMNPRAQSFSALQQDTPTAPLELGQQQQ